MSLWAQIDVGLRSDPKLFARSDSDFRLWVCLILYAKEHASKDGTIRGLTPSDLRSMFGIKAPVRAVEESLRYFAACPLGPMIELGDDWSITILAWEARGNAFDPEAQREKWRVQKERQRGKSTSSSTDASPGMSAEMSTGHSNGHSGGQSTGHVHGSPPTRGRGRGREEKSKEEKAKDMSAFSETAELPAPAPPASDAVHAPHAQAADECREALALTPPAQPQLLVGKSEAEQVFEHWRAALGKNANTSFYPKRRAAVEDRLAGRYRGKASRKFTVAELCRAVDGYLRSAHHRGANESGAVYDDLELFMRDDAHVEAGLARAEQAERGPPAGVVQPGRAHVSEGPKPPSLAASDRALEEHRKRKAAADAERAQRQMQPPKPESEAPHEA